MTLTQHASARMQQRAIPPMVLDLLDRFGSTVRCGGAEKLFFDKASRKRIKEYMGGNRAIRHIEPWLDVQMIVGDSGYVVTAAHRTKRIRRP